jgi:superfamily I DNA/RNA helicase
MARCVVACKSTVIVKRVVYMISQGVQHHNMLVLSFTNKAVAELKKTDIVIGSEFSKKKRF